MKKRLILCSATLLAVGCTFAPRGLTHVGDVGIDVRTEANIIQPSGGGVVSWGEMMDSIDAVDIILLGEQHDHAVGHAIQLAIVEDVMDAYQGSVLALEMLERDEQLRVDDYMEGVIDAKTFATITQSKNWGGDGGWSAWYQPIIDAAKERGGKVVAANAPRRYVRLARLEGYERIDELPKERRAFIDYPEELSGGRYRQRFWEFASHEDDEKIAESEIDVTTINPDDPMLPTFKSMQAWDATMAQSIVDAQPSSRHKVILLVGQFHVEYDGGIVQELRNRMPDASVLVVSIQRTCPEEDWSGSPPIADLMIVENAD